MAYFVRSRHIREWCFSARLGDSGRVWLLIRKNVFKEDGTFDKSIPTLFSFKPEDVKGLIYVLNVIGDGDRDD